MAKTSNLGLELTESNQIYFEDWRDIVNGNGAEDNKSNAQLIDEFAGKFAGGTTSQYLKKASDNNFDVEFETADTTPTSESEKLLTSGGAFLAINLAKDAVDTGKRLVVDAAGVVEQELSPDKFYNFTGALTSLTITLAAAVDGRENEYKGQFIAGSTAPTISFPVTVSWIGGIFPEIEANKTYQFSILDNIGVIVGV